jgi:predicted acetyltransferase
MDIRVSRPERRHTRVELFVPGEPEPASWLTIIDYTMRLGIAHVRMGGIAGVGTAPDHRMKGYSRACMDRAIEVMADDGYHCSMLFGIPGYYPKWGYATSIPLYRILVNTQALRRGPEPYPLEARPLEETDLPTVLRWNGRASAGRSGTLVRDAMGWTGFVHGSKWSSEPRCIALTDPAAGDRMAAYFVVDDDEPAIVSEVGLASSADARTMSALSKALADQATDSEAEEVTLLIPPDHPYAVHLRGVGASATIECPFEAEIMMRICNLHPLMSALEPELSRRCQEIGEQQAALTLITDLGATTIDLRKAEAKTYAGESPCRLRLPQWALIQLLMGWRDLDDVLRSPEAQLEGSVPPALRRLFPGGTPFIWQTDAF